MPSELTHAERPTLIGRVVDFSVQRRWVVLFLTALVAAVGVWSALQVKIDAVPDITNRQVQINTVAPAFSPVEMEKQITVPIETALAGMAGLTQTRSISRNGFAQVTAVFGDDVDIYFARQQVAERLAQAREALPSDVQPQMGPIATGLGEIYAWTVEYTGAAVPGGRPGRQSDGAYLTPEGERLSTSEEQLAYLRAVQDWIIAPQMKTTTGLAGVDVIGGYVKQYVVEPDLTRLMAVGLTLDDLARALERNNAAVGAGYIEKGGEGIVVRSSGRARSVEDLAAISVSSPGGAPIRVSDVARVRLGQEPRLGSATENGREVVIGTAIMRVGENSRTVAAATDAKLKAVALSLPPGVRVKTVLDRRKLVEATIGTVSRNLIEGAVLVIAVLFLLLGNLRAALITAAVIPITMLMTATGMARGNISANLMSFGALDFGLIVDGAVIISENALRRLAEARQAAGRALLKDERLAVVARSAREMIRPSVFGQAVIILVFLPLLAFQGVEGKMFRPMALTVMLALVSAFVLSLTFVPAALAVLLTGNVHEKETRAIAWIRLRYAPVLDRALARPAPVMIAAAALFAGALLLFGTLGQAFIPTLDEGDILVENRRIPSTGLKQSTDLQMAMERAVSVLPEVANSFSKTGTAELAGDPMPPNGGDFYVVLKPRRAWPEPHRPKAEVVEAVERALATVPGTSYEMSQPIQMRFNELIAGVRSDIALKIYGDEFADLKRTAGAAADSLRRVRGAADVKVEQIAGLPTLDIQVDRAAISRLGVDLSDVHGVVAAAVGGKRAGQIFEGDRRFDVEVRLPDAGRADLETLGGLPVPVASERGGVKAFLPLRSVAKLDLADGPNQISRENGKRLIVITANARGRDLGSVVTEAQTRVGREVTLPPGYFIDWGGQFENLASARARLMLVVPACFLLIFAILFAALGTVREALIVFSGVPLALTGGIAALWLRGLPFSVTAAVGFIALSGVAVLNGLVMVSAIQTLRREGFARIDAVRQGALTRLRPVVMTALVASLGFVPMAIATGAGAEVQKPLATVVIGGLISATLLTLIVLPALYRRFGPERAVPATVAHLHSVEPTGAAS